MARQMPVKQDVPFSKTSPRQVPWDAMEQVDRENGLAKIDALTNKIVKINRPDKKRFSGSRQGIREKVENQVKALAASCYAQNLPHKQAKPEFPLKRAMVARQCAQPRRN